MLKKKKNASHVSPSLSTTIKGKTTRKCGIYLAGDDHFCGLFGYTLLSVISIGSLSLAPEM